MAYTKPFVQTIEKIVFSDAEPATTDPGIGWYDTNAVPATLKLRDPDGAWVDLSLVMGQAATVAALGATANLTAVAGVFGDLAAARGAVNTLATEAEARLDAIETKVDAVIAALKAAKLMA